MKSNDPYTPVRVPLNPATSSNRPYYIYSTAVVMLLWASIYVYLQSRPDVSIDSDGVTISFPEHYAQHLYEFSAVSIAALFALSLAIVNSGLWIALKLLNR